MNLIKKLLKKISGKSYPYPLMQFELKRFANKSPFQVPNTKIDIVLLTLNRLKDTKRTIESLYKTNICFNLIAIDSNSDDGTREYLKKLSEEKGNIDLVLLEENLGVSGGRALSAKFTACEFTAFIDNDMVFMPGYFEHLVNTIKSDNKIAGVLGKIVLPNGKIQLNNPQVINDHEWVIFKDIDAGKDYTDNSTLEKKSCDWLPGVAIWRTEVLKKIPMDPEFIGAYEDNEHAFRVKQAGYVFFNCPEAIVMHIRADFTKSMNDSTYTTGRYNEAKLQSAIRRFYKKHGKFLAVGNIEDSSKYVGFKDSKELEKNVRNKN